MSSTRRHTALSAALTASLLAADIVLIALILNPGVDVGSEWVSLLVSLFLPYALVLAAAYFALASALGALHWYPRQLRPPLASLPWFTTLAWVSVTGAAVLFWVNLVGYRDSIDLEAFRGLRRGAVALTIASVALAAVAGSVAAFPYRRRGGAAAGSVLAAAAALVIPLALRPAPRAEPAPVPLATEPIHPSRRVTLVGLDGIGPDEVLDGVRRGRLPELGTLLARGAFAPLETLQPAQGPPVWTSIATGRSPRYHGVKSFVTYRLLGSSAVWELLPRGVLVRGLQALGLVHTAPVTAASRRRPALWSALNAFGIQTGVVRFWGTHPPEPVQGFMLSNYFHLLRADPTRVRSTLYPPDLAGEVAARAVAPDDVERALISEFIDTSVEVPDDDLALERELVDRALAPDLTYRRAAEVLRAAYDPPFFAIYFYGADVVGHTFTRFARPEHFGDVSPAQARRYGRVVERYAAFLASWIGEQAQAGTPDEILLVVSGYGMEPVPLLRRLLSAATGAPEASGTHSGAPPGFLLAVGEGVRPGVVLDRASVLDVAPTVLHLMGLPVGRDMEGRVLTELLEEGPARDRPVTYIPSYESLAVTSLAGGELPPDVPALLDDER